MDSERYANEDELELYALFASRTHLPDNAAAHFNVSTECMHALPDEQVIRCSAIQDC